MMSTATKIQKNITTIYTNCQQTKTKNLPSATHIPVPGGEAGEQFPPKFPKFGKMSNFSGSDKKVFWQNQNFSSSDMKNLGKVRNFRAATMINCKKLLANLGENLFFRVHLNLETKTKK